MVLCFTRRGGLLCVEFTNTCVTGHRPSFYVVFMELGLIASYSLCSSPSTRPEEGKRIFRLCYTLSCLAYRQGSYWHRGLPTPRVNNPRWGNVISFVLCVLQGHRLACLMDSVAVDNVNIASFPCCLTKLKNTFMYTHACILDEGKRFSFPLALYL